MITKSKTPSTVSKVTDLVVKLKNALIGQLHNQSLSKANTYLAMYEQGRITRNEYLILIAEQNSIVVNINIDQSVNAAGGRIVIGDENQTISSHGGSSKVIIGNQVHDTSR